MKGINKAIDDIRFRIKEKYRMLEDAGALITADKPTIEYITLFLASKYPGGDIYLSQFNMQTATEFEYYIRNSPIKADDPCFGLKGL